MNDIYDKFYVDSIKPVYRTASCYSETSVIAYDQELIHYEVHYHITFNYGKQIISGTTFLSESEMNKNVSNLKEFISNQFKRAVEYYYSDSE